MTRRHLRSFASLHNKWFQCQRLKLTDEKSSIRKPVKRRNGASYDLRRRLPRLCRKFARSLLSDQFDVFEPLSNDADDTFKEPARVRVLALVEPECLLVQIPEQMKRFHTNVSPANATLEQAPKVFQAV